MAELMDSLSPEVAHVEGVVLQLNHYYGEEEEFPRKDKR